MELLGLRPSYLPGVHRNYWELKSPDTSGMCDDRECITPGRFAPGNALNIRLCKALLARPKPTKRWFIASANQERIAQMFLWSKQRGPFISVPTGRGALVFSS